MTRLLILSDDGVSSGFGRISMTVNIALRKRGYDLMAASIQYDGLLPPTYEGQTLPYWVASLAGKNWQQELLKLIAAFQPDIIMVTQDAPYGVQVRQLPIDWSRYGFIMTTPVDGTPIYPLWVDTMRKADAAMTISVFGVNAYREAGVDAKLCRPGIDADVFYRMSDADRVALRQAAGIAPDAFVWGMAAQNQGRKDIPDTLRAFFTFAKDKPTARLVLDMDMISPAGWDIQATCQQHGWDYSKIVSREMLMRAGVHHLRERYNLLDLHSVISHREGFGLPLVEAMACGVVSMALDWCSGTEIVGEGRGVLVKPIDYTAISTWGGGLDYFPDIDHMVSEAQRLYEHPDERATIARTGMAWARAQTWTKAIDNVVECIERTVRNRQATPAAQPTIASPPTATTPQSVDGVVPTIQAIPLVEQGV